MKKLIVLFFFFYLHLLAQEYVITGKVVDSKTGKPLPNATIINPLDGKGSIADSSGSFNFISFGKSIKLNVSYLGYETTALSIPNIMVKMIHIVQLKQQILPSQTVLITGTIGNKGTTPLTFSNIKNEDLEKEYITQDIPQMLSYIPSVTSYSENGNGIGYNYISIRGFDQRRISVSINGIPQNDPEDHNVYWLDFPDVLSGTEFIQVQRGAGNGLLGYPAIGGSINIITKSYTAEPEFNLLASFGSYATKKLSASYSSGLVNNKYSFFAKLSQITSAGYRMNSYSKFNSFHFSALRFDGRLTTQVNIFGGPIEDGLAYTGLPKFAITDKNLRRQNYSYWESDGKTITYKSDRRIEEIENFSQPHYELLNEYKVNEKIVINSALFFVRGSGFFDYDGSWGDSSYFRLTSGNGFVNNGNPSNVLIRAQVENKQFGWIPRVSINHTNGTLIIGGEFRSHRSEHWGNLNYGENLPAGVTKNYQYYYYKGARDIINGFLYEYYNISDKLSAAGELQISYNKYKIYDEKFVNNDFTVSHLFLNPRLGINYKLEDNFSLYLNYARVNHEPRLKNYYDAAESSGGAEPQFEKTASGYNFDNPLVNPEVMNNFEIGSSYFGSNYDLSVNLFYMLFKDEIVKNGKLDRFGQPVTGNMPKTVHQGVEITFNYKPFTEKLNLFVNTSISKNVIKEGSFFIDSSSILSLNDNSISGFPDFIANGGISYSDDNYFLQFRVKYSGKFYSDNYADKLNEYLKLAPGFVSYTDNVNDAYFTADFLGKVNVSLPEPVSAKLSVYLQVNNIFDKLYSAYAIGQEFFPAAERNFTLGVELGL